MKTCPVCDTPDPDQHATCPTDGAALIETRELAPGQIVRGKYRIVRKLGQGGMGVVYQAEHLMLGGQLALKFLAVELSRNPQFIKRFRQEARAAYLLRHPNIVEVADLDQEEDGSLFIAMEYVSGPSLRAVLHHAPHGLPVERALNIARGLAAGLGAAHARGAIHRDIKPENILLAVQPDGSEFAKVLDFGIAAMTEGITNLSHTRGLLLTPEYAAPEQWRGTPAAELDGRTDLYALGGVLYEMLAGRAPFHALNMEGWMYQHLQGVPEPLGNLRPELAREYPGLEAIVMRLLAREREDRFPSTQSLLEALAPKAAASLPATVEPAYARPPETIFEPPPMAAPEPIPTASRRSGADWGTSSALPVPEPAPTAPRSGILKWGAVAAAAVVVLGLGIWLALRLFSPAPVTALPALAPPGGTYAEVQSVTISDATPNAVIHYTVDGTPPTEASPVYVFPIASLPSGGVLRAMAASDGHKPSSDVTGVYIWSATAQAAANPVGSAPAATGSNVYDQAKSAYDHKQYAQARPLFVEACNGGETKACNYLGYLYAQGLGGAKNEQMAREVYQKACDQGNMPSCTSLGSLYQDAGDSGEARKNFKKACDGGLREACKLLRAAQ
jgi:serine/threonine-protein kinase